MTDELTHKLTDQEREIAGLKWALKTKQNVIDRLLSVTLTDEEREAIRYFAHFFPVCAAEIDAASAILRKLLERLSKQNPSPSQ